jgi:hypothetical protein
VILLWKLLYRLFDNGDAGVEAQFHVASAEGRGSTGMESAMGGKSI